MVGFPGETDEDFEELMDFVREERFERMGAFCLLRGGSALTAEHYADDVPAEVKQERLDRLMALQEEISADVEAAKVGTTMKRDCRPQGGRLLCCPYRILFARGRPRGADSG